MHSSTISIALITNQAVDNQYSTYAHGTASGAVEQFPAQELNDASAGAGRGSITAWMA